MTLKGSFKKHFTALQGKLSVNDDGTIDFHAKENRLKILTALISSLNDAGYYAYALLVEGAVNEK